MNIDQIKVGMKVAYIPRHAENRKEPAEYGEVCRINHDYRLVSIIFDDDVKHGGWDAATPKTCRPEDLYPLVVMVD